MKTINKEVEDFIRNGPGDRSEDQIILLNTYRTLLDGMSWKNLILVTPHIEAAYKSIKK